MLIRLLQQQALIAKAWSTGDRKDRIAIKPGLTGGSPICCSSSSSSCTKTTRIVAASVTELSRLRSRRPVLICRLDLTSGQSFVDFGTHSLLSAFIAMLLQPNAVWDNLFANLHFRSNDVMRQQQTLKAERNHNNKSCEWPAHANDCNFRHGDSF